MQTVLVISAYGSSEVNRLAPLLVERGYGVHSMAVYCQTNVPAEVALWDAATDPGKGLQTIWLPFGGWRGALVDLKFIRALHRIVEQIGPDLIHIDADRSLLTHAMTALLGSPGIPVVVRRGAIGGLNALSPGDWLVYFGRRRETILCPSDTMRRELRRSLSIGPLLGGGRLAAVHHYVPEHGPAPLAREPARQSLGIAADAFVVGTACNIRPVKNLPTVARAVSGLTLCSPTIRFVVIGSADNRREARRVAAAIDADHLILAGMRQDARDLFAAFDVFVSPTKWTGEGFGLAIAEAMMAGCAIIVSDRGAAHELVGETGLVVPATDIAAWQRAILALSTDTTRRQQLGAAARDRARTLFAAERIADSLAETYARATSRPAA
jgi:glycosyltransferase involved in cell wall biosynthesis